MTGLEPHAIARLGVARTFQTSRLCLGLSVFDNVLVGMHARRRTGLFDAVLRRQRLRAEVRAGLAEASRLLALFSPGLRGARASSGSASSRRSTAAESRSAARSPCARGSSCSTSPRRG